MRVAELLMAAPDFATNLTKLREGSDDIHWYPYSSLNNIDIIKHIIPSEEEFVRTGERILDIGCADGDVGLLFYSLGYQTDFLDCASTNFNDCKGVKRSAELLNHAGQIFEQDIDFGFELHRDYGLAIFLGTLYHLRNPALVLIRLAQRCERILLSTRVASYTPVTRSNTKIIHEPIAYLLDRREANNDPTNWWIFSPEGLRRLLKRCGWELTGFTIMGAVGHGTPDDPEHDERIFCYCRRVANYEDLTKHHDF